MRFASPHFSIDRFLAGCVGVHKRASFAAFDGAGTTLGVANLIHLNPDKGEVAVIVRPDYKRHGIGRSLLAQVMQSAWDAGMSQLPGNFFESCLNMCGLLSGSDRSCIVQTRGNAPAPGPTAAR